MTEKKRKRHTFSEKISSYPADKISAVIVVLIYISIIELLILSTMHFNMPDHFLTLFAFFGNGVLNEFSALLKR